MKTALRPASWLTALILTSISGLAIAEPIAFTITDADTGAPVENAVVTLPGGEPPPPDEFSVVQKNRAFHPQVLVIPEGSRVNFPNEDNPQHRVYSFSKAKSFDIELYADQPKSPIHFDRAGIVELGCNIHDHMQGFILVTKRSLTGRTNAQGQFRVEQPTSDWEAPVKVRIWHPRLADTAQFIERSITPDSLQDASIQMSLEPAPKTDDELDQLQQEFEDL